MMPSQVLHLDESRKPQFGFQMRKFKPNPFPHGSKGILQSLSAFSFTGNILCHSLKTNNNNSKIKKKKNVEIEFPIFSTLPANSC